MRNGPEYLDVQKPALELLRDHLQYTYEAGEALANKLASEAEVLVVGRVAKKLKEINTALDDSGVRLAIDALRQPLAKGLIATNEACHHLMSR